MKSSTDVWFVGYLQYIGCVIESFEVVSKGKVRCSFKMSDEDWRDAKLSFNNSEFIKYKESVEKIKDLAW